MSCNISEIKIINYLGLDKIQAVRYDELSQSSGTVDLPIIYCEAGGKWPKCEAPISHAPRPRL